MKTNKTWTLATILIAGILAGFLIGRIGFQTGQQIVKTPETREIKADAAKQPSTPAESYLKPKIFETIANVSADDDPVMGSPDASLTVIEFTDYQCTFCRKYFLETFGSLKKDYIDTGKIKYVVRDYPLQEHPQALLAAEAADCANEQGKFREMHDLLFTEQDKWSYQNDALKTMKGFADQLQLDQGKFSACLDNGNSEMEINKDISDGELYKIAFTPTIFVGDKKIVGAQAFETFKSVIDSELNKLWQTQEM